MIILNFSGIYDNEGYSLTNTGEVIDMKHIEGTNGYCSKEAEDKIREIIKDRTPSGVRLIDNGNYHYVSKLCIEKIGCSFDLIVFDHHTDMQPSSLLPVLSCGSWIRDSLEDENIKINRVYLIGPPTEDFEKLDGIYGKRIVFISEEAAKYPDRFRSYFDFSLPVYISIDKDILSENDLKVNWDQGTMSADELADMVRYITERACVIGCDICGEPAADEQNAGNIRVSQNINMKLAGLLNSAAPKA